jgi:hypothetical protein
MDAGLDSQLARAVRSAECGVRNAECGVRNAECQRYKKIGSRLASSLPYTTISLMVIGRQGACSCESARCRKRDPKVLSSMARNCWQAKGLHSTSYVKIKESVVRNAERGMRSAEGRKQKAECGARKTESRRRKAECRRPPRRTGPAGGTRGKPGQAPALQGRRQRRNQRSAQQAEPERNSGRIRRGQLAPIHPVKLRIRFRTRQAFRASNHF